MNSALRVSATDNVATALEDLAPGSLIDVGGEQVVIAERIPRGHKLALRAIAAGESIVKYGSPIGAATVDIAPGVHVHVHNVASARGRGDLPAPTAAEAGMPAPRIAEPDDVLAAAPFRDGR